MEDPNSTPTFHAPPLTEGQRELFDVVTSGMYRNIAMVSATFDGHPVGVIAAINPDPEKANFNHVRPLAIITDTAFMAKFGDRLIDAFGNAPSSDEHSEPNEAPTPETT